jgi:hypothetical protein
MRSKPRPPDIATDPFRERLPPMSRVRLPLLGGRFEFECESPRLRRLVDWAFAGLPAHRLPNSGVLFRIRLALAPRHGRTNRRGAPRIDMLSGAGLLCGTTSDSDFAVVSPDERSALVTLSPRLMGFPYHARYELIEFAVFTLAARAQGLVPLHAACVGQDGRGLLLMGESGAGKSTTSLHCLLQGLEFVTEDSAFVTPDTLLATGVPNFLHVRRDVLRFVPDSSVPMIRQSPVIRRRSGVEKFEIDLRETGFRLARMPLKVTGLVFASAQAARDGMLLKALRRQEVLERLTACQPYAAAQAGWTTFREGIAKIPVFELRRGRHPAEAVEALQRLLADAARAAR